eukprot:gb/GFBE01026450.1/.p1 GENE.gb/GFBE01026450.1/~~gb/GFBE01026450.1/.p1  ORF type:complete len:288 (+),score=58.91 gb/GFBE01026450.1/:1-864(+)
MCGPAAIPLQQDGDSSVPEEACSSLEELEAREKELTERVPALLERMNDASTQVNTLEAEFNAAQARYKRLLTEWSKLYEDLRAQHGGAISGAIDRTRPYFEAASALEVERSREKCASRALLIAKKQQARAEAELKSIEDRFCYGAHEVMLRPGQQDLLSASTAQVLQRRRERKTCELERSCAAQAVREARAQLDAELSKVGASAIRSVKPCFALLQQLQGALTCEQDRISVLTESVRAAKAAYSGSLRELDQISEAVHEARRGYKISARDRQVQVEDDAPACVDQVA